MNFRTKYELMNFSYHLDHKEVFNKLILNYNKNQKDFIIYAMERRHGIIFPLFTTQGLLDYSNGKFLFDKYCETHCNMEEFVNTL